MRVLLAPVVLLLAACATPTAVETPAVAARAAPVLVGNPIDLADVFDAVRTSVVTVRTVERTPGQRGSLLLGGVSASTGVGSGVLVAGSGHVLTASHVVHTADVVAVEFEDGSAVQARVVATDPGADLACLELLQPPPTWVQPVELADSARVRVGQPVFVVGAPLGITHTLTVGHVSATREGPAGPGSIRELPLIQTDAAISPGNSGGPLFDTSGRVIGIVSHIVSQTGGNEGLGFAVASNVVRSLLDGDVAIWTGIETEHLDRDLAALLHVPDGREGALVVRVARGSLADRLGLRGGSVPSVVGGRELLLGGDILLEVMGVDLRDGESFEAARQKALDMGAGELVRVVVLRQGRVLELSASI